MADIKQYPLSEFYLYLKFGIWQSGNVDGLGFVQTIDVCSDGLSNRGCFVRKSAKDYQISNSMAIKQLSNGLYLLDLYALETAIQHKNSYLMVVSECRLKGSFDEQIYYLKVTSDKMYSDFKKIVEDTTTENVTRRWSPLRRKKRTSSFDPSPLNSIPRKH